MAKAVSLWRSLWRRLGWRKTDCPAKTVERGNSLAVVSQRFDGRLDDVGSQVEPRLAAKPSFRARSTYLSRSPVVQRVSDCDRVRALEGADVHFGDRHEDEVLVEAREAPDDGQERVDPEPVVAVDQLDGGHVLRVDRVRVDRALDGQAGQKLVQLPDPAPDLGVMRPGQDSRGR